MNRGDEFGIDERHVGGDDGCVVGIERAQPGPNADEWPAIGVGVRDTAELNSIERALDGCGLVGPTADDEFVQSPELLGDPAYQRHASELSEDFVPLAEACRATAGNDDTTARIVTHRSFSAARSEAGVASMRVRPAPSSGSATPAWTKTVPRRTPWLRSATSSTRPS